MQVNHVPNWGERFLCKKTFCENQATMSVDE